MRVRVLLRHPGDRAVRGVNAPDEKTPGVKTTTRRRRPPTRRVSGACCSYVRRVCGPIKAVHDKNDCVLTRGLWRGVLVCMHACRLPSLALSRQRRWDRAWTPSCVPSLPITMRRRWRRSTTNSVHHLLGDEPARRRGSRSSRPRPAPPASRSRRRDVGRSPARGSGRGASTPSLDGSPSGDGST